MRVESSILVTDELKALKKFLNAVVAYRTCRWCGRELYRADQVRVPLDPADYPYFSEGVYFTLECKECGSVHFFSREKVMKGA